MRPILPLPNKNQRNSLQNQAATSGYKTILTLPTSPPLATSVEWVSRAELQSLKFWIRFLPHLQDGSPKKAPRSTVPVDFVWILEKTNVVFCCWVRYIEVFYRSYWFGICINLYLLRRCFFVFIYRYVSGEQVIPSQELFGWEVILFHDYCLYLIGKVYNKRYPTLRVCVQCVQMMHVIFFWLDGVH